MTISSNAQDLERHLRDQRLPELLPDDSSSNWVLPSYDGYSLANLPATVAGLFGVPSDGMAPPLDPIYWRHLSDGVEHVVVVLIDALGYLQLQSMLEANPGSIWGDVARQGVLYPMTSICPSTTATALATVMSGAEPISHGLLGYELWLREYGALTQMLALTPALSSGGTTLMDWGLQPERFLPVPSLAQRLVPQGIHCTALVPEQFAQGALTRICYRGFETWGRGDEQDMWEKARQQLDSCAGGASYHFLYWGGVDTAIHKYGSADGKWQEQYQLITRSARTHFFERLTARQRRHTLFILIADHGFVDSPVETAFDTDVSSALQDELLVPHSGEARLSFLHCMHGDSDENLSRLQEAVGADHTLIKSQEAIRAGLFGHGPLAPESRIRLGHLISLSRGLAYLDRGQRRFVLRGRHGGLLAEEMLIPWLAMRLDA